MVINKEMALQFPELSNKHQAIIKKRGKRSIEVTYDVSMRKLYNDLTEKKKPEALMMVKAMKQKIEESIDNNLELKHDVTLEVMEQVCAEHGIKPDENVKCIFEEMQEEARLIEEEAAKSMKTFKIEISVQDVLDIYDDISTEQAQEVLKYIITKKSILQDVLYEQIKKEILKRRFYVIKNKDGEYLRMLRCEGIVPKYITCRVFDPHDLSYEDQDWTADFQYATKFNLKDHAIDIIDTQINKHSHNAKVHKITLT